MHWPENLTYEVGTENCIFFKDNRSKQAQWVFNFIGCSYYLFNWVSDMLDICKHK